LTPISPISLRRLIDLLQFEKFSMSFSSDAAQGDDPPACRARAEEGEATRVTDEPLPDGWYVELKGGKVDIDRMARFLPATAIVKRARDAFWLRSEDFQDCDHDQITTKADQILAVANAVGSICLDRYRAVEAGAPVNVSGGKFGDILMAGTASFRIIAQMSPGDFQKRLFDLLTKDDALYQAALLISSRPITWLGLSLVFDTIKRVLTGKEKSDHKPLLQKGWLTEVEAERFYKSMQPYRHGFPRRVDDRMALEEAAALMTRLFVSLAKEKLPPLS
jgi:hypothetical protein